MSDLDTQDKRGQPRDAKTLQRLSLEGIGLAIITTWVFNRTRGSLLLAILLHTSSNAALGSMLPMFFLSLAGSLLFFPLWMVVLIVVTLLVIAATGGCLSYQRYLTGDGAACGGQ